MRRRYPMGIVVNGRWIRDVLVDPHYEVRHSDVSDALILKIVRGLDGHVFLPESQRGPWAFYRLDKIRHDEKLYRLVWCLRDNEAFLGVINCFRR